MTVKSISHLCFSAAGFKSGLIYTCILYRHMHTHTHTHTAVIVQFSVFDIFWSPLGASAADVTGGTSLTLSAVLAFFPLKCQASSVLRCSTVYLLPLLSTLLIDAICAVITPLVIKQHFSLPVSGCQALLPCSVVVLFFFSVSPFSDQQPTMT